FTERDLDETIRPSVEKANSTIKGLHFPLEWEKGNILKGGALRIVANTRSGIRSEDPFLLQHSSGTTGLQKPVLLSHRAVLEHVKRYSAAIALADTDRIVSWLPLYHDMGLIAAFHLPLTFGIPAVQIDPFEWVMAPSIMVD